MKICFHNFFLFHRHILGIYHLTEIIQSAKQPSFIMIFTMIQHPFIVIVKQKLIGMQLNQMLFFNAIHK